MRCVPAWSKSAATSSAREDRKRGRRQAASLLLFARPCEDHAARAREPPPVARQPAKDNPRRGGPRRLRTTRSKGAATRARRRPNRTRRSARNRAARRPSTNERSSRTIRSRSAEKQCPNEPLAEPARHRRLRKRRAPTIDPACAASCAALQRASQRSRRASRAGRGGEGVTAASSASHVGSLVSVLQCQAHGTIVSEDGAHAANRRTLHLLCQRSEQRARVRTSHRARSGWQARHELFVPNPSDTTALLARKGDEHENGSSRACGSPYWRALRPFLPGTARSLGLGGASPSYRSHGFRGGADLPSDVLRWNFSGRTDSCAGRTAVARWPGATKSSTPNSRARPSRITWCSWPTTARTSPQSKGRLPSGMHVLLGSGTERAFRVDDFAAYERHLRARSSRRCPAGLTRRIHWRSRTATSAVGTIAVRSSGGRRSPEPRCAHPARSDSHLGEPASRHDIACEWRSDRSAWRSETFANAAGAGRAASQGGAKAATPRVARRRAGRRLRVPAATRSGRSLL